MRSKSFEFMKRLGPLPLLAALSLSSLMGCFGNGLDGQSVGEVGRVGRGGETPDGECDPGGRIDSFPEMQSKVSLRAGKVLHVKKSRGGRILASGAGPGGVNYCPELISPGAPSTGE